MSTVPADDAAALTPEPTPLPAPIVAPSAERVTVRSTTLTPISAIRLDGGTQARAGTDEGLVEDYAVIYRESPDKLPPLRAVSDGEHRWLYDGFHRILGAKLAGLTEVPVIAVAGTLDDARWLAVAANQEHDVVGKYAALWSCDWRPYFLSASEADLSLVYRLVCVCGGDGDRAWEVGSWSPLAGRSRKWARGDYRARTLDKALSLWHRRHAHAQASAPPGHAPALTVSWCNPPTSGTLAGAWAEAEKCLPGGTTTTAERVGVLCRVLAGRSADGVFHLDQPSAGKLFGVSHVAVGKALRRMVAAGELVLVERGSKARRAASTYRLGPAAGGDADAGGAGTPHAPS